jgi:BlaI family transcriptional regulator, penicillinase repressor
MPPKRSETLTEAELRVMNVLWNKGPASVQNVLDGLPEKLALAYNSVLTTIRVLEKKGYIEHSKDGRAHIYKPLIGRADASRSEVRRLVSRFFGNSQELLLNLLEEQNIDAEELTRLRAMIHGKSS